MAQTDLIIAELGRQLREIQEWMEQHQENRLVSCSAAGAVLGVSAVTVRRWAREGKITPYYTPDGGNRMKFWLADVKAMAKKGEAK